MERAIKLQDVMLRGYCQLKLNRSVDCQVRDVNFSKLVEG